MLGIGALVASWVSYATFTYIPRSDSTQWRLPLGLQMVPAVFLAALILLFPEVCVTRNQVRKPCN